MLALLGSSWPSAVVVASLLLVVATLRVQLKAPDGPLPAEVASVEVAVTAIWSTVGALTIDQVERWDLTGMFGLVSVAYLATWLLPGF